MAPSSAFIAKLNDAETQADRIIEDAKRNRKLLLTKARLAAQEELQAFSVRQEAQYQALITAKGHGDATDTLAADTARELSEVEGDFARHKDRTVSYVVEKVLDVPLEMSSTQKQALIAEGEAGERPGGKTFGPDPYKTKATAAKAAPKPPAPAPEPKEAEKVRSRSAMVEDVPDVAEQAPRGASVLFDEEDMKEMGGGWGEMDGTCKATITIKSLKATIGDKKMDTFVEIKYDGKGMRSQVVKDGGRDAVFNEELPAMDLTPGADLIFSVGDFDKKDGQVSKEAIGDTKPIKIEELATNDDGVFEGSFELFREGRAKNTGKLFVKVVIA